jgi:predicted  nucleic acid-binding Zn-ribbon protein
MNQKATYIVNQGITLAFSTLFAMIAWFIKVEISEVSDTLKNIKADVEQLNSKSLLLEQRLDMELRILDQNFSIELRNLNSKIDRLQKKDASQTGITP